jgi:proline racemase/trans-L-3-hydroxyproline dehydratase
MSTITGIIPVIDTYTSGEPTRVILRCPWRILGETMEAKRIWFEENCSGFRSAIVSEPRGHHDMFGAVLLDPVSEKADFGVFFLDGEATLPMCGHGSMGVAAALFKMGFPGTMMVLDTPSGLIHASILSSDNRTKVCIRNVPSFFVETVEVNIKDKKIRADIAWGGNLFALIRSQDINIPIEIPRIPELIEAGMLIRQEDCNPSRNVVIFGKGQVDRSPCGTGTSAKIATLFAKGKIGLDQAYRYQGILKTEFQAKATSAVDLGPYKAIIPEVQGEVFLTALQFLLVERDDPFQSGFDLR